MLLRIGKRARLETRLDTIKRGASQNSKMCHAATSMQPHPCKMSPSAPLLPAVLLLWSEEVLPQACLQQQQSAIWGWPVELSHRLMWKAKRVLQVVDL